MLDSRIIISANAVDPDFMIEDLSEMFKFLKKEFVPFPFDSWSPKVVSFLL